MAGTEDLVHIPVEPFQELMLRYGQDIMVVLVQKSKGGRAADVITVGRSSEDKEIAANAADRLFQALGVSLRELQTFEDYRFRKEGDAQAEIDQFRLERQKAVDTVTGVELTESHILDNTTPDQLRDMLYGAGLEINHMRAAVVKHHGERLDDRCWLSDQELYAAFGLPPADISLPPEDKFLANCKRFYDNRCKGGDWPSYQELEEKIRLLEEENSRLKDAGHFRIGRQEP